MNLDQLEVVLDYIEELGMGIEGLRKHLEIIDGLSWWQWHKRSDADFIEAFEGEGKLRLGYLWIGVQYDWKWLTEHQIVLSTDGLEASVTPEGKQYWQIAKRWK